MGLKFNSVCIFVSVFGLSGCVQPPAYQPQPIAYNNFNQSYPAIQPSAQTNPFLNVSNTTNIMETNTTKSVSKSSNSSNTGGFAVQANKYATQIQGISSYENCGITAVMVSIKNLTTVPLYIDWGQFSASNGTGEFAPYPPYDVATLIMNSEGMNQALNGAASGAVAGGVGGALVGGLVMSALGGNFAVVQNGELLVEQLVGWQVVQLRTNNS